jgi:hypothetical protein
MTNWGPAIPIIVAIIGLSGFILPQFSTTLFNQVYNKPYLYMTISSTTNVASGLSRTSFNFTNSGTMPATNLSLILTAENKTIDYITNQLSTVNVTLANPRSPHSILEINQPNPINGSFVELHIKKFVNGGGSRINLLVGSRNTTIFDYTVYATYDQGSTKLWEPEISPEFNVLYYIFYFGTIVIAESVVFWYIIRQIFKRRMRRFANGSTQEMIVVRKELRESLSNSEIFSDEYWTTPAFFGRARRRYLPPPSVEQKRRRISNINDYMRIDDFYSILAERNSYIQNQALDGAALVKLNKKCLELAENALEKIDWSKYWSNVIFQNYFW